MLGVSSHWYRNEYEQYRPHSDRNNQSWVLFFFFSWLNCLSETAPYHPSAWCRKLTKNYMFWLIDRSNGIDFDLFFFASDHFPIIPSIHQMLAQLGENFHLCLIQFGSDWLEKQKHFLCGSSERCCGFACILLIWVCKPLPGASPPQ